MFNRGIVTFFSSFQLFSTIGEWEKPRDTERNLKALNPKII